MNKREYLRLAKLNLSANSRQTVNTVVGLTLGLILLIPVVFMLFAFYTGLIAPANKTPEIFSVTLDAMRRENDSFLKSGAATAIESLENVENSFCASQYYYRSKTKYTVDDTEIEAPTHVAFDFIDMEYNETLITKTDWAFLRREGYGEAILSGASCPTDVNDVIVSSALLDEQHLDYDEVVGKSLDCSLVLHAAGVGTGYNPEHPNIFGPDGVPYGTTLDGTEVSVFRNFRIAGVFNANLYRSPAWVPTVYDQDVLGNIPASLWFNAEALSGSSGEVYGPEIKTDEEGRTIYVYNLSPNELAAQAAAAGRIFFPAGLSSFYLRRQFYQVQFADMLSAFAGKRLEVEGFKTESNALLYRYEVIYDPIVYATAGFGVLGVVMLVATVLNLVNTMRYSVDRKKGYMGMMRAVGMRPEEVKRLYFAEMGLILIRALIVAIVPALGACIGVTLGINSMFARYVSIVGVPIRLNFAFFIPAFLIVGVLIATAAFLIAHFSSHVLTRSTPLELLSDEEGV